MYIDLITGFLGAGKTTFLLKYAGYLIEKGKRIGILEYDHGAVNVDMLLLSELRGDMCEIEMVAAGCDNDCLKRRFKTKLISMAMMGYDRIIVEPSGIFDIDEFFDCLREEPLDRFYNIGNVISIVSAGDMKNSDEEIIMASQIAAAGALIISKTDLYPCYSEIPSYINKAMEKIRCTNGMPKLIIAKPQSELTSEDFEKLFCCGYRKYDFVKYRYEKEFEAVNLLKLDTKLSDIERISEILFDNEKYGRVNRIKGFVYDGGACYEYNATRGERNIREVKTAQNVLIIIGTELDRKKIEALF